MEHFSHQWSQQQASKYRTPLHYSKSLRHVFESRFTKLADIAAPSTTSLLWVRSLCFEPFHGEVCLCLWSSNSFTSIWGKDQAIDGNWLPEQRKTRSWVMKIELLIKQNRISVLGTIFSPFISPMHPYPAFQSSYWGQLIDGSKVAPIPSW